MCRTAVSGIHFRFFIYEFAPAVTKAEKESFYKKQSADKKLLQQKRTEIQSEIEKVEAELKVADDLFKSHRASFVIQNSVFPEIPPERISVPLFLNDSMRYFKYWVPDDGLLYVKDFSGTDAKFSIIKAIALRAIYSEPSAEVNMLYCASELNDEMFAFFNRFDHSI